MDKPFFILIATFTIGVVILLLTDQDAVVLRFNNSHGPSAIDLVGIALIMVSWILSLAIVVNSLIKRLKNWAREQFMA